MDRLYISDEQYRALVALPWSMRDGQAVTPISKEIEQRLGLNFPVGIHELRVGDRT